MTLTPQSTHFQLRQTLLLSKWRRNLQLVSKMYLRPTHQKIISILKIQPYLLSHQQARQMNQKLFRSKWLNYLWLNKAHYLSSHPQALRWRTSQKKRKTLERSRQMKNTHKMIRLLHWKQNWREGWMTTIMLTKKWLLRSIKCWMNAACFRKSKEN